MLTVIISGIIFIIFLAGFFVVLVRKWGGISNYQLVSRINAGALTGKLLSPTQLTNTFLVYENKNKYEKAYTSFLENQLYKDDFYFPDAVRYELVYIDEDNMPELLLAQGNSHVDRVAVYSYNAEAKQVEFLSSFSSFGKLYYVPKENTIISQYGNQGYYYIVYSEINEGEIRLKDIFLSDGSKAEHKYYWGFPVDEDFTGGYGKPNSEEGIFEELPKVTEEYRISEKEYEKLVEDLEQGSVMLQYDEMKELFF